MANNNSNTLVDEKLAISLFLDSLLTDTEIETEQVIEEVKPAVAVELAEVKTKVEEAKVVPEVIPEVKVDTPEIKIQEEVIETKVETPVAVETDPNVPAWASEPFQILLFEVAGLKLAVPLIELCGVIKWTDKVTEMPGHADFYMGILQHLDHKVAVIDTARMILPANKLSQLAGDEPRERVHHIVLIDDYSWGLACDKIGEVITLTPDDVKWRTSKTKRGWLAGTVIDHMCALLNSEGFATMLEIGAEEPERP